ncbi:MAG: L-lactate dehydrogenase [Vicinamibacterales bacterium]
MKIGIIGMGWVGSSVAISTLHSGLATELLLHDINAAVAEGEALDLAHGAGFYPAATVRVGSLDDMLQADAVVIAAGRGGKPNESRLDLLRDNAATVHDLATRLQGLKGLLVVVTNPVDVMTRVATAASQLPPSRVVGTGTMLDTARLHRMVGDRLRIDPRAVHAYVIGEHGDSEVVAWSTARAGGRPLRKWEGWNTAVEAAVAEQVRRAAYEIIARKGATNHAIGLVTANLLRALLRDERRVLTVSRVQEGALGVRDVAISLPAVVGLEGAAFVVEPELSEDEQVAFQRSAQVLANAAAALAM